MILFSFLLIGYLLGRWSERHRLREAWRLIRESE
mgnify:CR=1 FL=1